MLYESEAWVNCVQVGGPGWRAAAGACSGSLLLAGLQPNLPRSCWWRLASLLWFVSRRRSRVSLPRARPWPPPAQVEVHLMHMLLQGVLHTLIKAAEAGAWLPAQGSGPWGTRLRTCTASSRPCGSVPGVAFLLLPLAPAGTVPAEDAAAALAAGLYASLCAVHEAAGPLQAAEEPHSFWASVLSGQSQVGLGLGLVCLWMAGPGRCAGCAGADPAGRGRRLPCCTRCAPQMTAHVPLERCAASFLAALLHLAHASPSPQPYLRAAATMLGHGGEAAAAVAGTVVPGWEMCGLAAERVTAWMSQAGLAGRGAAPAAGRREGSSKRAGLRASWPGPPLSRTRDHRAMRGPSAS